MQAGYTKKLRAISAAAAMVLPILVVAGCGSDSDRSPEAYCRAFYTTAAPIRQSYVEAGEEVESDPLKAIVTLLGSPGDLTVIFDNMAKHAPDEIQPDTEAARDALKKEQDALGDEFSDPLGALGAGVIAGLTSSGSFSRVDAYLNDHCPVDSKLAQEIIHGSQ